METSRVADHPGVTRGQAAPHGAKARPARRSARSGWPRAAVRAAAQMLHSCQGSGPRASHACQNATGFSSVMRQTSAACHSADAELSPARIGSRCATVTALAAGSAAPIAPRRVVSRATCRPERISRADRPALPDRLANLGLLSIPW